MNSSSSKINLEKITTNIEFAQKTIQFYNCFYQETTDIFQDFVGLLEFNVGGMCSATDDLLAVCMRMTKTHSGFVEYFENNYPDKSSLDSAKVKLIDILLNSISNDVNNLIESLNKLNSESFIPFFEKPTTGEEFIHILSHNEGKSYINYFLNEGKESNIQVFSQIQSEYLEFSKPFTPSSDSFKLNEELVEGVKKSQEFAEKAIYGFRHLYNKNIGLFTDFCNCYFYSVKKIFEIHADLKDIYTKLLSIREIIRELIEDHRLCNPEGSKFIDQLLERTIHHDFFTNLAVLDKCLQSSAKKLGVIPDSIVRSHNYIGLEQTLKVLEKFHQHDKQESTYFTHINDWIKTTIDTIRFNSNSEINIKHFTYPVREGYLINGYKTPLTASEIYQFEQGTEKTVFRQISGQFMGNFKVNANGSLSTIQKELIEMLPYWLELNADLVFQQFGRKIDVSEIGVFLSEDRLTITLWGYGSIKWLDIIDKIKYKSEQKLFITLPQV
ncbi:TPA: hypothetical protein ACGIK9_002826 [Acinetobacter baumannii]|uniref:hypothetical protein n=1 Tax=Acinetobacter baumannii TaxID=470 RepID=UPI0033905259